MNQEKVKILRMEESFRDTIENELAKINNEKKKVEVKNIKYIGQAKWIDQESGKEVAEEVYIVIKNIQEKDYFGKVDKREAIQFYLGDRCVAASIGNSGIVYSENFKNTEIHKMQAMSEILFNKSGKEIEETSLNNLQKEEIAEVLSAHYGRKVTKEEVEKEMDKMSGNEIEELKKENQKKQEEGKDENNLSENQVKNIKVNGIQKVDLNKLIDGKETLGKRLQLQEYDEIYVVYSHKTDEITAGEARNNTTYSLVGMTKNGDARVLNDEFEIDKTVGNNANKNQTKIRANNTATRDNKDKTVYTRKSNGVSIGCENDFGRVNMFLYEKSIEENENVGIQIETSQTPKIPIETREILNKNHGVYHKDKIKEEIQSHTNEDCNPNNVKDFDGDRSTSSHEHSTELREAVDKIFNYGDVNELFNKEEVEEKLKREIENNGGVINEELITKVADEMDRDATMFIRDHQHKNNN